MNEELIDNVVDIEPELAPEIADVIETGAPKPKSKQYFTKETEDAIILYNSLTDDIERNRIYDKYIKYPFEKLVENTIHTYKFYHFDIPYEDVQHEVVAFLNEKIHKYTDPTKGKAFSYFSIVAKNYLIIHNNDNYNKFKNKEQLEIIDESRDVISEKLREDLIQEKREFVDLFVEYIDNNLSTLFKKQSDMMVADSVLELFRNRHNIEQFNKKALYILIRDRTGVKTQYITRVVNVLKNAYTDMYSTYKHTGRITLNQSIFKNSEFLE